MISLRGPKLRIFAGVIAVICIIAGIYLNFIQSRGFVNATATIVSVEKSEDSDGTTYTPTVEYTVGGKTYTETLNISSPSYKNFCPIAHISGYIIVFRNIGNINIGIVRICFTIH